MAQDARASQPWPQAPLWWCGGTDRARRYATALLLALLLGSWSSCTLESETCNTIRVRIPALPGCAPCVCQPCNCPSTRQPVEKPPR